MDLLTLIDAVDRLHACAEAGLILLTLWFGCWMVRWLVERR